MNDKHSCFCAGICSVWISAGGLPSAELCYPDGEHYDPTGSALTGGHVWPRDSPADHPQLWPSTLRPPDLSAQPALAGQEWPSPLGGRQCGGKRQVIKVWLCVHLTCKGLGMWPATKGLPYLSAQYALAGQEQPRLWEARSTEVRGKWRCSCLSWSLCTWQEAGNRLWTLLWDWSNGHGSSLLWLT